MQRLLALQCLSFLPPVSHHKGTTTNFPFSLRATAAEISLGLNSYMKETMNEGGGGAFQRISFLQSLRNKSQSYSLNLVAS